MPNNQHNQKPSPLEATLKAFSEVMDVKISELKPSNKLKEIGSGPDSLDMVEVIMSIEEQLEIPIPSEYEDKFAEIPGNHAPINPAYNLTIEQFSQEIRQYLNQPTKQ
jgi:acyl carrier protein